MSLLIYEHIAIVNLRASTEKTTNLRAKRIDSQKTYTTLSLFFSQFGNVLVFILLIAFALSIAFGDILDGAFILLIIIINGLIGFLQEYKAEKAVETLTNQNVFYTRVFRDNIEQEIDSRLLVSIFPSGLQWYYSGYSKQEIGSLYQSILDVEKSHFALSTPSGTKFGPI